MNVYCPVKCISVLKQVEHVSLQELTWRNSSCYRIHRYKVSGAFPEVVTKQKKKSQQAHFPHQFSPKDVQKYTSAGLVVEAFPSSPFTLHSFPSPFIFLSSLLPPALCSTVVSAVTRSKQQILCFSLSATRLVTHLWKWVRKLWSGCQNHAVYGKNDTTDQ